jgi:NAD(P)-dependent dehydrogenase (short-subunit alcohol dehydrogenase family)
VAPHLVAAGGGRVVNLNSGSALRAGSDATAYHASKTALARVTGSTHLAGWDRGVRAFDLMPGVVRTDMTASMDAHVGRTEWTSPEEVTALVLALASGRLDAFSGRFVRAGVDTPESLRAMADRGLDPGERTLTLQTRDDDPLR